MAPTQAATTEAVLSYMTAQNRPYSTNDIVLNLHNEHGKTAVQKALDGLTADGKITEKLNGKQKAYVINQADLPTVSDAELAKLDAEMEQKGRELKSILDLIKEDEAKIKELESEPTDEQLKTQTTEVTEAIVTLESRLLDLSANQKLVGKDEMRAAEAKREKSIKEWRKRKRMCLDITDAILENYPKSKKILFEEIGIETEQDLGIKMP